MRKAIQSSDDKEIRQKSTMPTHDTLSALVKAYYHSTFRAQHLHMPGVDHG